MLKCSTGSKMVS
uniref:Uncharacterized protein n=1 Tax=Rhizophora mucronata TaxID=61149 RepID=A0A2P2J3A1_RHIMU